MKYNYKIQFNQITGMYDVKRNGRLIESFKSDELDAARIWVTNRIKAKDMIKDED